jgi:hypothetical protein
VIRLPRRSVTRFFIPLIDVLILLFCIFLLMPFVSEPTPPDPADGKVKAPDRPLPKDLKDAHQELTEARLLIARLEREAQARVADRLSVRVLEIDPADGTLFYYDPGRQEVRSSADAEQLIRKQQAVARSGGVVKDVFFLILYPRKPGAFPTVPQEEQIKLWFKDVTLGFDIPTRGVILSRPGAPK